MRAVAEEQVGLAPRGDVRRRALDAGDHAGDHPPHRLRARGRRADRARRGAVAAPARHRRQPSAPARPALTSSENPRSRSLGPLQPARRRGRPVVYEEIHARRTGRRPRPRGHPLAAAGGPRRGRPAADRQGAARRVMTLLSAGHETTATALSWTLERLVRHPDWSRGCARSAHRGRGQPLSEGDDQGALRLRPVVTAVGRHLTAPLRIGGHTAAGGRQHQSLHLPAPPPARSLPRARGLPPRALPREPARHLPVDPLWRRRAPLPRRQLRPLLR